MAGVYSNEGLRRASRLGGNKGGEMERLIRVCRVQELPPGSRRVVILSRYDEALVLNVAGRFYALSNICPHAGAALERGHIAEGVLHCPLHGWGFDLDSGMSLDDPTLFACTYPVEIHGEELFLRLPEVVQ